jgi:hypothetical protein
MAGRTRSPNYPSMGLSGAVELARQFWNAEKRARVPAEVAIKALGFKSLSGSAKIALGALNQYGLVERTREGLRLSELGLRVLHPAGSDDRDQALTEAAETVALFRDMREQGGSNEALRSYLITKRRFTEDGANAAIKAFRDTMAVAKLDQEAYDGDMPMQTPTSPQPSSPGPQSPQATIKTFSWPLSDGVTASVTFSGISPSNALKPEYFEDLRDYLDLAKRKAERES